MGKRRIKAVFNFFNGFEYIWLFSVVILLSVFIGIFPDVMLEDKTNAFVVICSAISIISSPVCELLISKQSRFWTLFSLFFVEITDIFVLFNMELYSSAFLSLFFWIPFDIMTFITWSGKNIDEEKRDLTKVKNFTVWQDVLIVALLLLLGLLCGKFLPLASSRSNAYVVAFSNVFEIANGIFLLMRRSEQWLAWFGYLICEVIIWISLEHYVMLITVFAMMINTVYGFVKWLLYNKTHPSPEK